MDGNVLPVLSTVILSLALLVVFFYYNKKMNRLKILNKDLSDLNKNYLDVLGFVSHELKGIMGSAIMCVHSVRDGFLGMMNFKQRKALDSAVRNLERMESTVKNYLDLSRIEKGELNIKKAEVNLNEEIIREAMDNFSKQSSEKGMVLENKIPADAKIFADKDLMITVHNNLISNAIKYGRDGGRIILKFEDSAQCIRLSVYNDGIPIPMAKKDNLFKKFSRLTTEQLRMADGSGLGLFIVKEIIEKHGGKIWFEPKEKGNEFIFEIKKD